MAKFNETDRHFIGLLQDTINRMASNSANCKTWLLAIITAVVAFVATNKSAVNLLWKEALTSYSTWPFYLVIMAATLIMIFVLSDINIHICIKCCCCCC